VTERYLLTLYQLAQLLLSTRETGENLHYPQFGAGISVCTVASWTDCLFGSTYPVLHSGFRFESRLGNRLPWHVVLSYFRKCRGAVPLEIGHYRFTPFITTRHQQPVQYCALKWVVVMFPAKIPVRIITTMFTKTIPDFSKLHFIFILPYSLRKSHGLFLWGFPTKMYTLIISPMRSTCPTHHILPDCITLTILCEKYKLSIPSLCTSFHPSGYFPFS